MPLLQEIRAVPATSLHTTGGGYMRQLDGLRAFAVFCTMVTHFTLSQQGLIGLFPWGQVGVRIFYVLSGFLITGILLRSRMSSERGHALAIFYARRLLRIFPLYYGVLAVAAAIGIRPVRETLLWHLAYLSNLYQVVKHPAPSPVTHFWSLAVEEQFYLVWPFLMILVPRRHLLKVIFACIAIGPAWRIATVCSNIWFGERLMFGCLDTLGIGALLAYCRDGQLGSPLFVRRLMKWTLFAGVPAFAAFLVSYAFTGDSGLNRALGDSALALAFCWLVARAAVSFSGPFGTLLEWKPISYLGKISYGVYILHPFMAIVLFYALKWRHLTWEDGSVWKFLTLVAMSIAAAACSWHFFEAPINSLKRYFELPRVLPSERVPFAHTELKQAA